MEPGTIYHLYNHANGFENLFNDDNDYDIFLSKLLKHTVSIADYYAYCLMPNHFHFLLQIKTEDEILRTIRHKEVQKKISKSFSNVFAGFTLTMNHKYSRIGSLFKPNMQSRLIEDENDFCGTAHYIHANPVHHGFVKNPGDWNHSSFRKILENDTAWLNVNTVFEYFGNIHEFIKYHDQPINLKIKEKHYF